jgi:hypothetical protein
MDMLNVITLGKTDNINQLITISSEQTFGYMAVKSYIGIKTIWKIENINRVITLTVITIRGPLCIKKIYCSSISVKLFQSFAYTKAIYKT